MKVTELAENRLRGHSYRALRNVSCIYQQGRLTLRGRLPSYYLKQVAQEVVSRIEGIGRISNEIEVLGPQRVN